MTVPRLPAPEGSWIGPCFVLGIQAERPRPACESPLPTQSLMALARIMLPYHKEIIIVPLELGGLLVSVEVLLESSEGQWLESPIFKIFILVILVGTICEHRFPLVPFAIFLLCLKVFNVEIFYLLRCSLFLDIFISSLRVLHNSLNWNHKEITNMNSNFIGKKHSYNTLQRYNHKKPAGLLS